MKIDQILSNLRNTQDPTKTAAAAPLSLVPAPASTTAKTGSDALVGALNTALAAAPAGEKTAGEKQAGPVTDVMKVAEELAATEHEANIKHAQVMGAAFADAFVARIGTWQTKAAELNAQPVPTAPAGTLSYAKFAQENPGLVAQANQFGYDQTKVALEKQANVAFADGHNDAVAAIHKTAAVEFIKGAHIMGAVLEAAIKS